jgi:hypothetical protein
MQPRSNATRLRRQYTRGRALAASTVQERRLNQANYLIRMADRVLGEAVG